MFSSLSHRLLKLKEKAAAANNDFYVEFISALEGSGSLGVRALDVTDAIGVTCTYKSSLTELQARHALLDTQDPNDLELGKLSYELSHVLEAIARAGDKK